MRTEVGKPEGFNEVRHYVKTSVPVMCPLSWLNAYRVHYGLGRGIGYRWVVRLVTDETCHSVEQLHQSQSLIMEITRNLPAPWEVESLYCPSGFNVPKFRVRSFRERNTVRCIYGWNPGGVAVKAHVRWLRSDEGGRRNPPSGEQYSTVARFEDQTDEEWKKNAWSLVVDFTDGPDDAGRQIVSVRFLSENGPIEWLSPSRSFALFEGGKKVAEGVVLGET